MNRRLKEKILIVDDDPEIRQFLESIAGDAGYDTAIAVDGAQALHVAVEELPNLVILDLNIPVMDGFEVCRRIRKWSQVPIIVLSGRQSEEDKVNCLDAGADDYVTKPFGRRELLARIRTALRRKPVPGNIAEEPVLTCGDINVDLSKTRVTVAGREVNLTPIEFNLLRELATNSGKVLTHGYLLSKVWGSDFRQDKEYLHVFIGRLRAKLAPGSTYKYITTVPGVGYQLKN
ncbi:MAG: response regulator transcription factor [Dehalococcoidia bacterium]